MFAKCEEIYSQTVHEIDKIQNKTGSKSKCWS